MSAVLAPEPMILTQRWTPLRPHPVQLAYWDSPHRFNVIPAGRRSGKTERFKRKLVKRAIRGTQFPNPRFFAAAPTREQAKRIFWEDLKALVPRWLVWKISEGELVIWLENGSSIWVIGLDKPQRMEGQPWDGGGVDEFGNVKPDAWPQNIRPALSDRKGWCDLFGVPEGRNHYYDIAEEAKAQLLEHGDKSEWGHFHWKSAEILTPEEIASARSMLDELTFQQEYEASFVNFEGRIYYAFTDDNKARLRDRYNPDAPLIICLDFNIAPGVAEIAQEMTLPNGIEGTGFIGEVWIERNSNTPAVCRKIIQDWGTHRGRVIVYGDATGGAGGSAQTEGSDWDLAKKHLRAHFGSERVSFRVPESNPAERARVNAVNSRCKAMDGTIRLMVDPVRCPHLVKDFEGVRALKGGSGEIDKKIDPMLTHPSDAAGYYIEYEFPTRDRTLTSTTLTVI